MPTASESPMHGVDAPTTVEREQILSGVSKDDFTPEKLIEVIESLLESVRLLHRHGRPLIRKMASGKGKRQVGGAGVKARRAFVVPVHVNEDIAQLFELDPSIPIARADVTNKLNEYIKTQNLQLPENRKHFRIDATFSRIFGLVEGETSNFFQMQKYINKVVTSAKNNAVAPSTDVEEETTCALHAPPLAAAAAVATTTEDGPDNEVKPTTKSAKPLKKMSKK